MTTNELLYLVMLEKGPQVTDLKRNYRIDLALQQVTGYNPDDLMGECRKSELTEPRQLGMYFYFKGGYSLTISGMRFNRDHATVVHAAKKIENLYGRKNEQILTQMVNEMCALTGVKLNYVPEHQVTIVKFENEPIAININQTIPITL